MKIQVVGFEITQGISKKSGQPYAIGKLHCALPLAPAQGQGNVAKGYMGSTYQLDVSVLRKIEHLDPPFSAEVEMQDLMRFGERKQEVVSVVPVGDRHVSPTSSSDKKAA